MSRNGSGGYSNPSTPFQTGTVISAAAVNANFADIATALTQSICSDGQTPNVGPIKGRDGAPGGPTYTFQNETATGFYRVSNGIVGLAIGGVNVASFSATSLTYNGTVIGTGVPSGAITAYAGSAAPTGWLLCFGQAVLRTGTNAALFAAIGTQYGIGDGTTTFNLPDLRGNVIAGLNNMGGTATTNLTALTIPGGAGVAGSVGGAQQITLTHDQIPTHTHPITDPGHTHTFTGTLTNTAAVGGVNTYNSTGNTTTASGTTGITATDANTPADAVHNNVQPTMVMNYIIKT